MRSISLSLIPALLLFLISCSGNTEAVDSGTYTGTIEEVNAGSTEIYVNVENEGTLELYFTEETSLTRNGNTVEFSELSEGQQVEVEVEKVGQRLDPLSVKILE
jgi:hypothetical protein